MFISISKTKSDRYVFHVGENPSDDNRSWISSYHDAAVLGETPSTFSSFGEAHAAASRLIEDRPFCVLAKKLVFYAAGNHSEDTREMAEGEIVAHYVAQVDIIGQRIVHLRDADVKDFDDEIETVKKVVIGIKDEISNLTSLADGEGLEMFNKLLHRLDHFLRVLEHMSQFQKKSSTKEKVVSKSLYKSAIRAFSEAAMLAVMPLHKDVFVKGAMFLPKTSTYESVLSNQQGDLIRLSFDKNLLLTGIYPCKNGLQKSSLSSVDFFLQYWEPIVHAVGHFYSKGHNVVAVSELDLSNRNRIKAFSMTRNSEEELVIDRPTVMGCKTWTLRKESAQITNPPVSDIAIDDEVECTASHLPTYFGRTGVVTELSDQADNMICRVDFRRGIGPVWLEITDLKKVDLGEVELTQ